MTWACSDVQLKLIQAGRPTQNAYVELFNARFRDECLNEHVFRNLAHARAVIARWGPTATSGDRTAVLLT